MWGMVDAIRHGGIQDKLLGGKLRPPKNVGKRGEKLHCSLLEALAPATTVHEEGMGR